jgi:hypothetical protein
MNNLSTRIELKRLYRTQLSEKYFKNNLPDIHNDIINIYHEYNISWREMLYLYINDIKSPPLCPICGHVARFNSVFKGYHTYCSTQCAGKSMDRLNKIHDTIEQKYGVRHALQSSLCKKKYVDTSLKKYGVVNISNTTEYKQKMKQTMIRLYGGLGNSSDYIRKKCIESRRSNRITKQLIKDQIGYTDDGNWVMRCTTPIPNNEICENCNKQYIIKSNNYYDRLRLNHPLCTKHYPVIQNKNKNTLIELFIKSILDEYNIEYQSNIRNIINPKEIDIYIPSKQIAIECNGVYWHSSKPTTYHIHKYIECQKQNIQLLTIWEDWVKTKPEIVKSIILSKLGIYKDRLGARQCVVKEISAKLCKDFLNENHIQGHSPSSIKIGLYYDNKLVSVMTFGKTRVGIGKREDCWELIRFCNLLNTQVIGGASKLIKYFIKQYNPDKIISYSSNDISKGNLYSNLGFKKRNNHPKPSYWYIHKLSFIRYHRSNFCKSKLISMGYDISNKTESDIMQELPYWKIYDSGTTCWVLNL